MKITPADSLLASSTSNYTQLASKFKLMQPHAHKRKPHDDALTATLMLAVIRCLILPMQMLEKALSCTERDAKSDEN